MTTFVPQPSFASVDLHHPSPQSKSGNHLLQQHTLLGVLFRDWIQHRPHSFSKHLPDTILQQSRTLHVFNRPDLLGQGVALLLGGRGQTLLLQLLHCFCIAPQVPLGAHQQDGHVGAVVRHLRVPLVPDIGVGGGAANGKADDENVGLGIGESAQAVVLLLARCVPQVEADGAAVYAHLSAVVVKHGGNVLFGEGIGGIRDE